ncbi:MAG: Fibronectin type III protein [Parcubacteria group bacterium Gr01-1014_70]|nr:MAG: Fibronectin type III protein [Parcubacteria group bacterium Gr01-1014_70]
MQTAVRTIKRKKNTKKHFRQAVKKVGIICVALISLILSLDTVYGEIETHRGKQKTLDIETSCVAGSPTALITWSRDNGAITYRYALHRAPPSGEWSEIVTTIIATSYMDVFFPEGPGVYQYKLVSYSALGKISYSEVVSADIPACPSLDDPTTENPTLPPPPTDTTPPAKDDNLIRNSSLTTTDADGNPQYWSRGGWGTNTRIYRYPVPGVDDSSAAKVDITSFTDGDAKWYFDDVPVTPGNTYEFSHAYKANVDTKLFMRFETSEGYAYKELGNIPKSDDWTTHIIDITAPTGASLMTLFHAIMSVGSLTVDSYMLREQENSTPAEPAPQEPAPSPTEPAPDSPATSADGHYVMLNAITWEENPLQNIPLDHVSEVTYFVLSVNSAGNLMGGNESLEKKFIADAHAKGKKATLSVAGGAQNVADITSAIMNNRQAFINNIDARLRQFGYDGVVLDIENTELPSHAMPELIKQLRIKIGPAPIIGAYVQHWQMNTVHDRLEEAADALTWIAPMIYDFSYTVTDLKSLVLAWLPKVKGDKSKLLAGVAVNYETGLTVEQYMDVLRWIDEQGLGGVGIWQNAIFTKPWQDAQSAVWPQVP